MQKLKLNKELYGDSGSHDTRDAGEPGGIMEGDALPDTKEDEVPSRRRRRACEGVEDDASTQTDEEGGRSGQHG